MNDMHDFKPMLDVSDIQEYLGLGKTKTYEMIGNGEIKSVRVGRSIKIPRKNFIEYLKNLEDSGN
jgi:excisionase family DNA binding protein